jgi:hypothetical protein
VTGAHGRGRDPATGKFGSVIGSEQVDVVRVTASHPLAAELVPVPRPPAKGGRPEA